MLTCGTYSAPYRPDPTPFYPVQRDVVVQPVPVVVQQAPVQQESFGSRVASTATGVVAGELIHDALVSNRRRDRDWEEPRSSYREPVRQTSRDEDETPVVSYRNEVASFRSGSDNDSWTDRSNDISSSTSTTDTWTQDNSNNDSW